jgi:hypothetical protein
VDGFRIPAPAIFLVAAATASDLIPGEFALQMLIGAAVRLAGGQLLSLTMRRLPLPARASTRCGRSLSRSVSTGEISSLVLAPPSGVVAVGGGVSSSALAPPLTFLNDWLDGNDSAALAASLRRFVGTQGYDLDELRTDLALRLFGTDDGTRLFNLN